MSSRMVLVNEDVLDQLMKDSEFLSCLRAAGVDNWEGYCVAQDMMEEEEEDM